MGKNKAPKAKATPKASVGGAASASAKAAAPGAPGGPSAAAETEEAEGKDYFSRLKPEEQERELKKREEREKKAAAAKKKEEEDRSWREWKEQQQKKDGLKAERAAKKEDKETQQALRRAFAEGVLEADEYPEDGCWYVEPEKGTWKMVTSQYWCRHCDASLNLAVLGSHLDGEKHRKKLAWQVGPSVAAAPAPPPKGAPATPAAPPGAPPAAAGGGCAAGVGAGGSRGGWSCPPCGELEPWQELDPAGCGYLRCKACNKMCDGNHEHTAEHKRRVEAFMWQLEAQGKNYPPPPQVWLAWVPEPSFGEGRFLKCLLCKKWVQDLDREDTVGYVGTHGDKGAGNQKDHARYLWNLDAYLPSVRQERKKYHPEPTVKVGGTHPAAAVARGVAAAPAKATPAPWAAGTGSPIASKPAAPPVAQPGYPSGSPTAAGPTSAGAASAGARWGPKAAAQPGATPGPAPAAGSRAPGGAWGQPVAAAAPAATASAAGPPTSPPGPPPGPPALPPGWNCKLDEASGNYYYYNAQGTVQWEPPDAFEGEVEEC